MRLYNASLRFTVFNVSQIQLIALSEVLMEECQRRTDLAVMEIVATFDEVATELSNEKGE